MCCRIWKRSLVEESGKQAPTLLNNPDSQFGSGKQSSPIDPIIQWVLAPTKLEFKINENANMKLIRIIIWNNEITLTDFPLLFIN